MAGSSAHPGLDTPPGPEEADPPPTPICQALFPFQKRNIMTQYLVYDLILHIVVFQLVILVVSVSNIWLTHRARQHKMPSELPKVSILVPARNEEVNIAACVRSLLSQDYPDFEVLVLDDQSTDNTPAILQQVAREDPRLKVIMGSTPPVGQVGKNWACAQLASQAQGDLLYFTDADTVHQPQTLHTVVTALLGEKADVLTGFPRQLVGTWGERLLVPFFSWASLSFIPLWLAYWLRSQALSIAVGQMMLFRREAYQAVGGHAALGKNFLDDIGLVRRIKKAGLRWRVLSIADLVKCRMYQSSKKAYEGLTKSLFGALGYRLLPYLFITLWLLIMTWVPIVVFGLWLAGLAPLADPALLLVCLGLALLTWLFPLAEIRAPLYLVLFYPIIILANAWAMLGSLIFTLGGKLRWKDRALEKPRWKWL
ncbi:MAG: glycosyltransferase family 2 protein [Anaerolineaceae bacterium]|nr:glycosyltransferase family 2 protein [Anaerolineaceae bacterium]